MGQENIDSTVLQTLKSISSELRTQKFILRGTQKRIREFKAQEQETRVKIKHLVNKIEWELSLNFKIQNKDNTDFSI